MDANTVADGIALFFLRALLGVLLLFVAGVVLLTMGFTLYALLSGFIARCKRMLTGMGRAVKSLDFHRFMGMKG